jgi:signal transduction histidine kinase/Tfp pilus assembly protein PilF
MVFSCHRSIQNNADHITWADSVTLASFDLMSGPVPELGLRYIDSAYQSRPERGVADIWRKYNTKAHYYAHYQPELSLRRMYVDSMFTVLDGVHDQYRSEYAQSMFMMASLLHDEKKYNEAFKVYYDGWSFARKHQDHCSMTDFNNALGNIRYQQEQYEEAIPYLKQALADIGSCDRPDFQYRFILPQSILNSIALCYEKSARPDSALAYYHRALTRIDQRGKDFPQKENYVNTAAAVVEGNLGGVYMQMRDFRGAERHLRRNIRINDRPGYAIEDAQTAKVKLARLYIDHGAPASADSLLDQLQSDLQNGRGKGIMHTEIWNTWYELKWLYFDKTGNLDSAYHYLNRHKVFSDSLDRVKSDLKNADMDQVFKEHRQQFQLTVLQKNSEIKSLYLLAAVIILILMTSIALVTRHYLNKSRRNVKELTSLNYRKQLAMAALENSQKENTRIMKVVAHDLRSPIGAITAMADLMLQEDNRSAEDIEALALIKSGGENSLQLVNNLLQLNTPVIEELTKNTINLADLIQYCADMLNHQAQKKHQRIEMQIASVIVKVNYEKMWRVISNLLTNAIKFSPEGSRILIKAEQRGDKALIMVTDEGIGIPDDLEGKIFDHFTEAKRAGTSGEESFGLGLSISRQIVEAHGGRIWFENNMEKGTTFSIEIPASSR